MKKQTSALLVLISLFAPLRARTEEPGNVKHPVTVIDEHRLANDKEALAKDKEELRQLQKKLSEAKIDLKKTQKVLGTHHEATQNAKRRVEDLKQQCLDLKKKKRNDFYSLQNSQYQVVVDRDREIDAASGTESAPQEEE